MISMAPPLRLPEYRAVMEVVFWGKEPLTGFTLCSVTRRAMLRSGEHSRRIRGAEIPITRRFDSLFRFHTIRRIFIRHYVRRWKARLAPGIARLWIEL